MNIEYGSMQADKCQCNCQVFLKRNVLKLKFKKLVTHMLKINFYCVKAVTVLSLEHDIK